jgi:hypothetical protein
LLLDAYAAYLLDGPAAAASLTRQAQAALDQDEANGPVPFSYLRIACWMAGATGDDNRAHAIARKGVEQARREGAMTPLAMLLILLGESCLFAGEIGAARDAFAERREIKSAAVDFCRTGEVVVLAWRGEERAARSLAAVITEDATRRQHGWRVVWAEYALSVLELALGHYRDALASVTHDYEENPVLAALAWSDQIEAAVRCGKTQLASEILARLAQRSGGSTAGPAVGLLARSQALLADGHDAERLYLQAIDQLSGCRGKIAAATPGGSCRSPGSCSLKSAQEHSLSGLAGNWLPPAHLPADRQLNGRRSSPRRRRPSRAWRPRAPRIRRSPRSCSSARAPSITTCARCSGSSVSRHGGSCAGCNSKVCESGLTSR